MQPLQGLLGAPTRVAQAWRGLSVRERALLYGLAVVLCATAAFLAAQWSQNQRDRHTAAAVALANVERLAVAAARTATVVDPADVARLEGASISAPNPWLARLKVEEALSNAAVKAGVASAEIHVAEALEGDKAAPVLRAEIEGPLAADSLARLISDITAGSQTVLIEGLRTEGGGVASFKLTLKYPVRIDPTDARR